MTIKRLFTQDPGLAELTSVSAIVAIDNAPPVTQLGAGTGVMCMVGEFERGPVNTPTEILTADDLDRVFGGLGWAIPGNLHAGPVAQQSGGNEPWNGNGFVALANKRYNRLVVQRVDTSVGTIELERLACLTFGAGQFAANNGDQIVLELDGGPTTTSATVDAFPAVIDGSGAVFPLVAPGGKTVIASWDDQDPITATLADTDVALADVIARLNGRFAATIASNNAGQLRLSSVRQGSRARMQIVGGTALADLGLPTAVVQDVWTLTVTADTAINTELRIQDYVDGLLVDFVTAPVIAGPVGSLTLKRDAILAQLQALAVPGFTFAASGVAAIIGTGDPNQILVTFTALQGGAELTIVNTTPGVALEVFGTGNVGDSQNISVAEAANIIDQAANVSSYVNADGLGVVCNTLSPGTGKLEAISGALLTAFGFTAGLVADAAAATDGTIPAGTRFQDSTATATIWVATEDVQTGTGGGPFAIPVRPFYDTDTAIASNASDVSIILDTLFDGFAGSNPDMLTRLSAAELDARYITAIQETNVEAQPANEINVIVAARSSVAIANELRNNCLVTTAGGLAGRKCIVRPRIGSTLQQAFDFNDATGRDERKQCTFPGVKTAINAILEVGAAGGVGFSDDGLVEVGFDSFLAAFRTKGIRPEESAAQDPSNTNYGPFNVVALESLYDPGTPGSIKLGVAAYQQFKARGIAAPKPDRTQGIVLINDVTSAAANSGRTAANRRWFADFINDSLFIIGLPFRGRLITPALKRDHFMQLTRFFELLKATDGTSTSRLEDYSIRDITNPAVPEILRTAVAVRMYGTADVIVYSTTVGPTVQVTEQTAA